MTEPTNWRSPAMQRRVRRRYAAEHRFRLLGLAAIVGSGGFLAFLLFVMIVNGAPGFVQTRIDVPIDLARTELGIKAADLEGETADLMLAGAELHEAMARAAVKQFGPGGDTLISDGAWQMLRDQIKADPSLLSRSTMVSVPASSAIDIAAKGRGTDADRALVAKLRARGSLHIRANFAFLSEGDSTDPTLAGIWGALKGSVLTMIVTLGLSFPVGVLAALYLEEYAPRNGLTDLIEVSINNLAAVPSIIFGLLGLAVFLNLFDLPRSAALVGGLTLALMTMPVIVIAGRNAIKAVPPSIRDAALAVGASPVQVVFHHVLPLALPGILTGTIIGMARALGETAPLLMIGMRAFIASPPSRFTDPATVLPVQIFLWSDEVSRGFIEKTSAAIIVLLVFLLAMNGFAVYLRNRFETRW